MWWLLCIALVIPSIDGFCSVAPVKIRKTASGRNLTVCTLINGLEILNGSTVVLASCETCKCEEKQLSCCGFGHMAGKGPTPPKHCKKILDGCNEIMVRKSDETRECSTGNSILVNRPPKLPSMWPYYGYNQQYRYRNVVRQPSISMPDLGNWIEEPFFMDTTPFQRRIVSPNRIIRKPQPDPGHPESASQIFNGHSNGASKIYNVHSNGAVQMANGISSTAPQMFNRDRNPSSRIFNGQSNVASQTLNVNRNPPVTGISSAVPQLFHIKRNPPQIFNGQSNHVASQILNGNRNPPVTGQYIDRRFTQTLNQDPYPFGYQYFL